MNTLTDFMQAIEDRLNEFTGPDLTLADVVIVRDDKPELDNLIEQKLAELGALILITTPAFTRAEESRGPVNQEIACEIGIGENPLTWRENANRPTCLALADFVIEKLQGYEITGFQPLAVIAGQSLEHKTRKIFEITLRSRRIVQKTS